MLHTSKARGITKIILISAWYLCIFEDLTFFLFDFHLENEDTTVDVFEQLSQ